MGMRPGDKDLAQEERAAARTHDAAHQALCIAAVTEWNRLMERRHKPGWLPMIGVDLAAKYYFLRRVVSRLPYSKTAKPFGSSRSRQQPHANCPRT